MRLPSQNDYMDSSLIHLLALSSLVGGFHSNLQFLSINPGGVHAARRRHDRRRAPVLPAQLPVPAE